MRLHGRVYKDGKFWLAEVPMLDAMTQGRTRKEALVMVTDLLETLANRPGFAVHVHPGKHDTFEVSAADTRGLMSLILRRQRERSGLSLAEAAARLGAKSRNAYARYERGTSVPTLDKLTELLQAVAPGQTLSSSRVWWADPPPGPSATPPNHRLQPTPSSLRCAAAFRRG